MVESMFKPTLAAFGYIIALVTHAFSQTISIAPRHHATLSTLGVLARLQQSGPDTLDTANFDPSRWDHYVLIAVCLGITCWGLWSSWHWK